MCSHPLQSVNYCVKPKAEVPCLLVPCQQNPEILDHAQHTTFDKVLQTLEAHHSPPGNLRSNHRAVIFNWGPVCHLLCQADPWK